MYDASRHREALAWQELDHTSWRHPVLCRLEVDEESSLDDIEELVVGFVAVPVILALHDAESDDGLVHSRERLVVPLVADRINERVELDLLERSEHHVQVSRVRKGRDGGTMVGHRSSVRTDGRVGLGPQRRGRIDARRSEE